MVGLRVAGQEPAATAQAMSPRGLRWFARLVGDRRAKGRDDIFFLISLNRLQRRDVLGHLFLLDSKLL